MVATPIIGAIAGFVVVFLHRFMLNNVVPVGFIGTIIFLIALSILVRHFIGTVALYVFTVTISLVAYWLSTLTTGDILVSGGVIAGEKPWAGAVGLLMLALCAIIPLVTMMIPQQWIGSNKIEIADTDLKFMQELVEVTDKMLLKAYLTRDYSQTIKTDGTPVTEIDVQVEQYIRDQIHKRFPHDTILGEELGADADSDVVPSSRRWIIDPIDGTKNFLRNLPVFATLVALEDIMIDQQGATVVKPIKSVVSAPLLKCRWLGATIPTKQAWMIFDNLPPQPIEVSKITEIDQATISISSRSSWITDRPDKLVAFDNLTAQVARTRGFGDFYSYMLLAQGCVDIATEPNLELYDIAALIPIVEGAGGSFTDITGEYWIDRNGIKSSFATNSRVTATL